MADAVLSDLLAFLHASPTPFHAVNQAESRLRETGRNSKSAKPLLDAVAAQLILQTWFESPHHVTPS